eukprot:COSAG06_NODE_34435_length_474_cov_1.346667_1_plen_46_part_10
MKYYATSLVCMQIQRNFPFGAGAAFVSPGPKKSDSKYPPSSSSSSS